MNENKIALNSKDDWRTQWDGIYSFVCKWLQVEFSGSTPTDRAIDFENLTRIGYTPAACEWFQFATSLKGLESQFTFRDCLFGEPLKSHDAISLLYQGERDVIWAIEAKHQGEPNPPVTVYKFDYEDPAERFVREGIWSPTVTSFAFNYFLSYLESLGGGFRVSVRSPIFCRDALIRDFGSPVEFGHLELFYTDGIIAVLSKLPANWHSDELMVEVQRPTSLHDLPPSIQQLTTEAHCFTGMLGRILD